MKKIIISDIHGNLEALNTALEYIDKLDVEKQIVCLGDIVGYGPNPVECMEKTLSITDKICLGNHDYTAINEDLDHKMVWHASEAIKWTRKILDDGMKKRIKDFKVQIEEDNILYAHASPDSPMKWQYITNAKNASSSIAEMKCSLCFVGHSHIPGIYANYELHNEGEKTPLSKNGKTIVNIGSVGQPRDGSPMLSFAVFDDVGWNVEIIRQEYDYQKTMSKIEKAGFPSFLAERLMLGK